ncbi:MAG TPA: hypothetical protein VFW07_14190 [Parafilimonas sp.]|nr:hypothetical protein [Parafilimonas sp.]
MKPNVLSSRKAVRRDVEEKEKQYAQAGTFEKGIALISNFRKVLQRFIVSEFIHGIAI